MKPLPPYTILNEPIDGKVEVEPVHPLATFAVGVFVLFCFLTWIGSF